MKENKYSLFIDGEFVEGSTKEWFEVINPADESLVGLAAKATVEDAVNKAAMINFFICNSP